MTDITLPGERQVGHLTLLRQERKIGMAEFNALSKSEQLNIIHQHQGKKKYDLILNSGHAEELVPQLHPQEVYLTVNDLGADDSSELLALASPEQINLLLDLDCWDNDRLSPVLSLHWLQLLLGTGEEKVSQLVVNIEPEILALFLKKHLVIRRGIEAYDDDDAENAYRLESLYDIDYHSEDAAKTIGALLNIWMVKEQESYLLIMEMIRSEQLTTLEEEMFQSRNNRLLDLGILPTSEARELYTHVDPANFTPGGKSDYRIEAEEQNNPAAILTLAEPDNLLADILAGGVSQEQAIELLMLANRKLSADNVDLSSAQQLGEAIQSVYDTLNLALEYLTANDIQKAEQIFATTYLLRLFQLGHSLIQERLTRAKSLAKSPLYSLLDYQEFLFIDSLLQSPPALYFYGDEDCPGSLEPIKTLKDLELLDMRLAQISALLDQFTHNFSELLPQQDGLEDEIANEELPTLAQLFITAVANQLLGLGFSANPLLPEDLAQLKSSSFENGQLSPEFAAGFAQSFPALNEDCRFFIDFCLALWEDSLLEPQACAFLLVED